MTAVGAAASPAICSRAPWATLASSGRSRSDARRHIRCSSRPSASVWAMRSVSASSSASPQRRTDAFTGCQLHPSSSATSPRRRPSPPRRVAQRPARVVSFSGGGAISAACSVTVPVPQPPSGQRHRRLCQTSRAGQPNAGRSTSATGRSPLRSGPRQASDRYATRLWRDFGVAWSRSAVRCVASARAGGEAGEGGLVAAGGPASVSLRRWACRTSVSVGCWRDERPPPFDCKCVCRVWSDGDSCVALPGTEGP